MTWGHTVTMAHLDALRARSIPSVSYHLDLWACLDRGGGNDHKSASRIGTHPFWKCDYVFSPDGDPGSAEFFERHGVNHRHVLPAVVRDEAYIAAGIEPTRDAIFVGSGPEYHAEWPYRGKLLRWLSQTYGPRFAQYGGRGKPVRGHELNMLYASAKVAVGDSLIPGFTHTAYCSDRRYEAPGRGAFQVQPWIDGIDDGMVDGVNTVFYRFDDFDGLRERIDHYLDPANDDEREKIRRAGHEHVKANHTYHDRLTQALDLLHAEGALR
jgi:hypothetical protein